MRFISAYFPVVRLVAVAVAVAALAVQIFARPAAAQPAEPISSRPPNVVLIFCDDLGYGDVGYNGRSPAQWQTPVLDSLAKQGTTFRRFYAAAPVCAPSRAALLTGRYTIHNGVTGNSALDLPASEVTIAEALKQRGYATGLFGKWHAGQKRPDAASQTFPLDQGFDEFYGYFTAGAAWQKFPKKLYDGRTETPADGYADTLFTTRAIDFIERNKDRPFFAYVPYVVPHGVVEAPAEQIEKLRGRLPEVDAAKPINATYAAEIVQLDVEVGRILAKLDELKLADDTIVIFTSDHGGTFEKLSGFAPVDLDSNAPFRGQKRTLWEGGIRVPGVIRWPGKVPAQTESHELVHMTDLLPTLLAAAGGTPNPAWTVDGANLLDVITGKAKGPPRTLFWEWDEANATFYAAMRGNLKLVISGWNKPELYDVEKDVAERIDIASRHPDVVRQLRRALNAWLETTTPAARLKKTPATRPANGRATPEADDL